MTSSQRNGDEETGSESECSPERLWQGEGGEWEAARTAVVLECVLQRVGARELWACSGVCRAWRHAAARHWRRHLLPAARPATLRALARTLDTLADEGRSEWSWRKEYALENARWERCDQLLAPPASSAPLMCADLHSNGSYLAVVDEDARVTVYERVRPKAIAQSGDVEWAVQWSDVVKTEWRNISFAQWAPRTTSLLLAGRLALVDRFELLCINFDDEWQSKIVCRSASGPGGAACWVDDYNFLSTRLQLLAPGHACTTVWLNAASQETYSEFAGVTAPLLRIYNEAATHISHILVTEVSKEEQKLDSNLENVLEVDSFKPNASYYNCLQKRDLRKGETRRLLVAAAGAAGGVRGEARALAAWRLPALQVPLLWVEDHLAQRVQRHRLRLLAADEPEPEHAPDEDVMRALCTPPDATCCLSARILGLVLHPRGGCVWASTTAGATCVSLPALQPVLQLPLDPACDPLLSPHYVFPSVDDDYFVTPQGGGSGLVCAWAARSGRAGARLRHAAPALAAFLLPRRTRARRLLVLTADHLHLDWSFINILTGYRCGSHYVWEKRCLCTFSSRLLTLHLNSKV